MKAAFPVSRLKHRSKGIDSSFGFLSMGSYSLLVRPLRQTAIVSPMRFNSYELRQAAIDGVKLTLESPTRQVDIKVTDQGQPVSGATVNAQLGFGIELRSTTGTDGIGRSHSCRSKIFPSDRLDRRPSNRRFHFQPNAAARSGGR